MTERIKLLLLTVFLAASAGCHQTAAVDLIAVAREGLADARLAEQQHHERYIRQLTRQMQALDDAFDADVRLAAAGQITNADGEPVALTADWVISARKGYTAAREIIAQQMLSADRAHAVRMDNLSAADEALEMACDLLLRQAAIAEPIRRTLLEAHGRWIDDRPER
ncbi:MAG: hypothetical protein ACP5HU_11025 [Phycisphaerae bacterium]